MTDAGPLTDSASSGQAPGQTPTGGSSALNQVVAAARQEGQLKLVWGQTPFGSQDTVNLNPTVPTQAMRNGDLSIADQFNDRAIIVNRDKQIVFQYGMTNVIGNGPNQLDGPYTAFVVGDYTGQTPPPRHF